nr:isochorismatase family protein [Mycobacterium gastri]
MTVDANPYVWPFDGGIAVERTALINIDWQVDFAGEVGYVDTMGYDLSLTRTPLGPARTVLCAARELGLFVVHTREGHRPDLSDLPANKRWRSARIGAEIGAAGPRGRIRHYPSHLHRHTTDVCVHTTLREANDRGYECLVLSDCTGATDYSNHLAALKMITMQGGVFGAHSTSAAVLEAFGNLTQAGVTPSFGR